MVVQLPRRKMAALNVGHFAGRAREMSRNATKIGCAGATRNAAQLLGMPNCCPALLRLFFFLSLSACVGLGYLALSASVNLSRCLRPVVTGAKMHATGGDERK